MFLFWRQLGGEVRLVADDQRPHFVIDRLDRVEGFNLATDGRKFSADSTRPLKISYDTYALDRLNALHAFRPESAPRSAATHQ